MNTDNEYYKEAKDKLKALAETVRLAKFYSRLDVLPINVALMSTKQIDEKGFIWFLSSSLHGTVTNIERDNRVQLSYADPSKMEFMSVYGEADIISHRDKLKELYSDVDDTWIDGVYDPNLIAIVVKPKEAHYWEPKSGKIVTLLKMAISSLSGLEMKLGEKGKINP